MKFARFNEQQNNKQEQTPEEISSVLETALETGRHVDLVIAGPDGAPNPAPDLIVERFEGDELDMTYLEADGDVGPLIPLNLAQVKKAELRE